MKAPNEVFTFNYFYKYQAFYIIFRQKINTIKLILKSYEWYF